LRGATPTRAETALVVFAKAPQPGRVKTRLVPRLGRAGAARLHARLVERAVRTARAARLGPVELHCTPRMRHPFFAALARRHGLRLRAQGAGKLGERMHRAFCRVLREADSVVLIGSDCPALRAADLRAAARALRRGADAVLAPAEDGGYALVGLRRARWGLFRGIAWGGPQVLAQTRARLRRARCKWVELRTVWDVDRPEDVARLRRSGLLGRTP
jgi:hypothetical protein